MVKAGTWRDEHATLLEQYASAMGTIRQADAALARDGSYFTAKGKRPVAHPALKVKAEQAPIARALARALGLINELKSQAVDRPAVGEFGDLDL
jgi:phage terminase small subunit